ncbi:hypothetical protein N9S60_00415 [bacterium]|nr:hypothetical protein [bacterium]
MDERQLQEEQIKKKMLDILHKQEKTKMEYQKKRNFKTSAAFNDDKDEEEEETVTMNPRRLKTSAAFNEDKDEEEEEEEEEEAKSRLKSRPRLRTTHAGNEGNQTKPDSKASESKTTLRENTEVRNQIDDSCFSHAVSTALRSTLYWKKKHCDKNINIPEHHELQALSSVCLTSSLSNCFQMCFPIKNINEDLSQYNVELFNINTKDQLLRAIDRKESHGISVVAVVHSDPSMWRAFTKFGRTVNSEQLPWSYYDDPDVGEVRGKKTSYEPIFPSKKEKFLKSKNQVKAKIGQGHVMYISGRGTQITYKKQIGSCVSCGSTAHWEQLERIKNWYDKNPGEHIEHCRCKIETPYIELKNSWGEDWGKGGYAKIKENFIEKIIPLPKLNDTNSCKLGCGLGTLKIQNLLGNSTGTVLWSFIGIKPINCGAPTLQDMDRKERGGSKTKKRRKYKNKKTRKNKKYRKKTRRKRKRKRKRKTKRNR